MMQHLATNTSKNKRKLLATASEAEDHAGCSRSLLCAPFHSSSGHNNNHAGASTLRRNDVGSNSIRTEGDRLIAEDMLNLSLEERQKVYEQIHGVDEIVQETDELVAKAMDFFDREMTRQRRRKGRAIDKVAFLKASRLKDKDLILQFLRCEDFDGIKAAQRFVAYFDFVYEFFGVAGILADRLSMKEHLSETDIELLRRGTLQPFPDTTDRSGRPILMYPGHSSKYEYESLIRAHTYLCLSFIQNSLEAQRRGIVGIVWRVGPHGKGYVPPVRPSSLRASAAFHHCMPMKVSAAHFCFDNPKFRPILEFVKLVMGKKGRVRFRPHFGSFMECSYNLISFGVDVSKLPIEEEGKLSLQPFQRYLDGMQQQEEALPKSLSIIPRESDILLGRGKPFTAYPGNQRLSKIVDEQWEEYNALERHEKTPYCRVVTSRLRQEMGVRFLKRRGDEWQLVSDDDCVQKVAASFRNKPVIERYHAERFWQKKDVSHLFEEFDDFDGEVII